ncbi:MAG: PrgI family protein [Candidatus Nomurabacteria bacterium]|nr:PrgI family protein [Candidatus Nomurabacteria bacterium]
MQFKVPQFIDIEDKLFGPFTFRQFAYLAGGGGMIFVIYKIMSLWIGIFLIIPIAGLTAALVFYRINNQPFIYYLQAGINYFLSGKLYIWKQRLEKPNSKKEDADNIKQVSVVPQMSSSRLKDISWGLDMREEGK